MRHYKKGRKLGTDASHTKAIKKNLVVNLFTNDRIKTTLFRAKEIRGDVDRVITWAKRGDVHSRRLAIAAMGDKNLVAEIFAKVEQGLFKDRPGGYTRILKLGTRRGDSAPIVIIELVQEPVTFKKNKAAADEKPAKKPVAKKAKAAEKDETTKGATATEAEDIEAAATAADAEAATEVELTESAEEPAADAAAEELAAVIDVEPVAEAVEEAVASSVEEPAPAEEPAAEETPADEKTVAKEAAE